VYTVVLNYLTRISGPEVSVVETFSCSTIVDHTESWFHAARVVVTLLARKARKWRSRAGTVRTPVIFSARLIISAWQSIVVCPGQLVGTVTILLKSNIMCEIPLATCVLYYRPILRLVFRAMLWNVFLFLSAPDSALSEFHFSPSCLPPLAYPFSNSFQPLYSRAPLTLSVPSPFMPPLKGHWLGALISHHDFQLKFHNLTSFINYQDCISDSLCGAWYCTYIFFLQLVSDPKS